MVVVVNLLIVTRANLTVLVGIVVQTDVTLIQMVQVVHIVVKLNVRKAHVLGIPVHQTGVQRL